VFYRCLQSSPSQYTISSHSYLRYARTFVIQQCTVTLFRSRHFIYSKNAGELFSYVCIFPVCSLLSLMLLDLTLDLMRQLSASLVLGNSFIFLSLFINMRPCIMPTYRVASAPRFNMFKIIMLQAEYVVSRISCWRDGDQKIRVRSFKIMRRILFYLLH